MALTPMMQQYQEIKAQHQDALLLFRLGDFYELFFDDAVTASRVLDITLTGRDAGSAGRIPMCGVPFHAADGYIAKLIDEGFAVAICEQTENPKEAKGLVKREVTRIISPGTALYDDAGERFLAAVVWHEGTYGVAFVEIGTGFVGFAEFPDHASLCAHLFQTEPCELLVYEHPDLTSEFAFIDSLRARTSVKVTYRKAVKAKAAEEAICRQYQVPDVSVLGIGQVSTAVEAIGMALMFIHDTQKTVLQHMKSPEPVLQQHTMTLDMTALRNLEILETQRTRQRKGSLLSLLDRTKTAMGSRTLRHFLERPLSRLDDIILRQDAVEALYSNIVCRSELADKLSSVYDLERLMSRVSFGTANGRDLLSISRSLAIVPRIRTLLVDSAARLQEIAQALPDLEQLAAEIERTLVDEPPVSVRDGGLIREGVYTELDTLRRARSAGKAWLAELEQRERQETGIRSLKVGYNKVFGYYIEVSNANTHLVPPRYERRQTLSTGERYVLPELKEQEARILGAEEQAAALEEELFRNLLQQVAKRMAEIQQTAHLLGEVDALQAFATISAEQQFVRPQMVSERILQISAGRHPVVESAHPGKFVPNDVELGPHRHLLLITGPNMAGKSTYMRQVALAVLMAHAGCFVAAKSAVIGLVDRIFTRIGASDDVGGGQSTFMVEMVELAAILRQATDRSLVILDEIGRGTSTYDGLSIAEAVMEALHEPGHSPLTLFASHYHELTTTAQVLAGAANCSVAVAETKDGVTFLHSVVPYPADKSYGIQVAKLAGIPKQVIQRAQALLDAREASLETAVTAVRESEPVRHSDFVDTENTVSHSGVVSSSEPAAAAVPLFQGMVTDFLHKVAQVDVLQLTPLAAQQKLYELIVEAREIVKWVE